MIQRKPRRGRINLSGWAVVVGILAAWQILVAAGLLQLTYLPSPAAVASAGLEQMAEGSLQTAALHTLLTAAIASLIAAVAGMVLGAAVGLLTPVRVLAGATIDFLRTVPAVSLMPVAVLLYGPTVSSEVLVGVFAGIWPILLSTVSGVQGMQPRLHEVGRVLHLSRAHRVRKIYIPSAVPSILVGLRLGVVTTLIVVIIAEMLINPVGIGWEMIAAQQALRPDVLFAYAALTGLLGYLVNLALVVGARLSLPGSPILRSAT